MSTEQTGGQEFILPAQVDCECCGDPATRPITHPMWCGLCVGYQGGECCDDTRRQRKMRK